MRLVTSWLMFESWEEAEGRVNVRLAVHEGWGHAAWRVEAGWACVCACVCVFVQLLAG